MPELTLGQRQKLFTTLIPKLLDYIHVMGYECTFGDAWSKPEYKAHKSNSMHYDRCALDLNLFKDGVFLTKTEDHKQFGEYWKSLHSLCRWGGDFAGGDGNHYSITYLGRA